MPKALESLELTIPYLDHLTIDRKEALSMVKQLSKMLSENTADSKLETIVLDKVRFRTEFKDFLTFVFGYNINT